MPKDILVQGHEGSPVVGIQVRGRRSHVEQGGADAVTRAQATDVVDVRTQLQQTTHQVPVLFFHLKLHKEDHLNKHFRLAGVNQLLSRTLVSHIEQWKCTNELSTQMENGMYITFNFHFPHSATEGQV